MIEVKAKEEAKKIVAASGIADGCMRLDRGHRGTDAKIGGDDSSVAAMEKVGASSEHLQVNSLPGVAAPGDA
ncbi:unnamed protein product [Camellia sinensis]